MDPWKIDVGKREEDRVEGEEGRVEMVEGEGREWIERMGGWGGMRGMDGENGPCLRCRVIRERYVEGSHCGQQLLASLRPGIGYALWQIVGRRWNNYKNRFYIIINQYTTTKICV